MEPADIQKVSITKGDALIIVDVQEDFLPGGNLPVSEGDQVVPVFNRYIDLFQDKGLPVYATRDWHPARHSSFKEQGGPWPKHCVVGSEGAKFAKGLKLPASAVTISAGTELDADGYSGFEGTDLDQRLRAQGTHRLFIGGLATDVCVLHTVRGALKLGYKVFLLTDASRAVNLQPENGSRAVAEMTNLGARPVTLDLLD
jgi:nicotinamidase/pyrazinamidase